MNKICKEYISEIKALFPTKRKRERDYIKKTMADIESYCEEAEVTTKLELYENYGKPNDVVNSYLSTVDTEYLARQIKVTRFIKTAIITLLVLATAATSALCIHLHVVHQKMLREEAVKLEYSISEYN